MKRTITSLLCCVMLLICACCSTSTSPEEDAQSQPQESSIHQVDPAVDFSGLDDTDLLYYLEDYVGGDLENSLGEDYQIESVSATYVSKEYIEELTYNSTENVYFGYTLSEIESQFKGEPFVFTLGDDGETTIKAFEKYDNTFEQVMKNVAIGTGIILLAVTVSAFVPQTAIQTILVTSAKSAAIAGSSSGILSGAVEGVVKYVETGDIEKSFKTAALAGSEEFKWGALGGAVAGGASKALAYSRIKSDTISWRKSERIAHLKYGGETQVAFLNKEKVSVTTPDSTRPDILRKYHGHYEAIEVKNYAPEHYGSLLQSLKKEIPYRNEHLPEGTTQRVTLSTIGQNYSKKQIKEIKTQLKRDLKKICPACSPIPVDIIT